MSIGSTIAGVVYVVTTPAAVIRPIVTSRWEAA